ncbi:PE family protein [Pseudonocardia dioxanivorans]|uniref:PE family protein n=1 Tax=Pseudonocardia dioxanivorans TaxID=240495 RepID=UPI00131A50F3|nr:PE family protein [Pseudonocardia dioxanivorans]
MRTDFVTPAAGDRFDVSPEYILRAAQLLRAEADRVGKALYALPTTGFQQCGNDPVSTAAAAIFNEKSRALLNSYEAHVIELRNQADALATGSGLYRSSEHVTRDFF